MDFRTAHPELQHLAREHDLLRRHNLRFKEGDGQGELLMFAEGALIALFLERFLRALLGYASDELDGITTLLQTAVKQKLLVVPWPDQEDGIQKIARARNKMLHGDYEQAAVQAGCATVEEYFDRQYASEIETLWKVVDDLLRQIDPTTGKRFVPLP